MCIVEQKTYYQADGSPRISESIRRCENAIGLDVCLNVNYSVAKIVETRPEPSSSSSRVASASRTESSSKGHVIVTDSRGQTRVYHDLNRRSSQRNKSGRSRREEDRNPRDHAPSSAFNTERSSPVSRTATPNSAPPRMSSFPPTLGPAPSSRVTADGTAIYDYPTSDTRRVPIVERRPASPPRRKVSFKETPHDNDATDRRRPGLSVNTGGRRSTNTSPTRSSPGLSQLPNLRHARKDSARDLPPRSTSREDKEYTTRESAREEARRILAHAEASRRRQEDLRAAEDRELDLEAERAERGTRLADTLRPARASIDSERSSRSRHTTPPRRQTYYPESHPPRYASSSPITSRPSLRRPSYGRPTLHQDPPSASASATTTKPTDSIRSRGVEVVSERRRARASLTTEEARSSSYDRERRYEPVFDDYTERTSERKVEGYYVSEGPARLARRRRDREWEDRKKEFWS